MVTEYQKRCQSCAGEDGVTRVKVPTVGRAVPDGKTALTASPRHIHDLRGGSRVSTHWRTVCAFAIASLDSVLRQRHRIPNGFRNSQPALLDAVNEFRKIVNTRESSQTLKQSCKQSDGPGSLVQCFLEGLAQRFMSFPQKRE